MLKDTLKEYKGQFIAIKTKTLNTFGGVLETIDDDHIVLTNKESFARKYGNGKILIATSDVASILFDYDQDKEGLVIEEIERRIGSKNERQSRKQNPVHNYT